MKNWKQSKRAKVIGWRTRNGYQHRPGINNFLIATAMLITSLYKRRK
jgi:hypothetical protein